MLARVRASEKTSRAQEVSPEGRSFTLHVQRPRAYSGTTAQHLGITAVQDRASRIPPSSLLEDLKTPKSLSSTPEFLVPAQEVWVAAQEFTRAWVGLRPLL